MEYKTESPERAKATDWIVAHPTVKRYIKRLENSMRLVYNIFGVWRVLDQRAIRVELEPTAVEVIKNKVGNLIEKPRRIAPEDAVIDLTYDPWDVILMTAAWRLAGLTCRRVMELATRVFVIPLHINPKNGFCEVWTQLDLRYDKWKSGTHGAIQLIEDNPRVKDESGVRSIFDETGRVRLRDLVGRHTYNPRTRSWVVHTEPEFSFTGGSREEIVTGSLETLEFAAQREFYQETLVDINLSTDFQHVSKTLAKGDVALEQRELVETYCNSNARGVMFPLSADHIANSIARESELEIAQLEGRAAREIAVPPPTIVAIMGMLTDEAYLRLNAVRGPRYVTWLTEAEYYKHLGDDEKAAWNRTRRRFKMRDCDRMFHIDNGLVVDGDGRRVAVLEEQSHADWTYVHTISSTAVRNLRVKMFDDTPACHLRRPLLEFFRVLHQNILKYKIY
jgi:hypothetical protein